MKHGHLVTAGVLVGAFLTAFLLIFATPALAITHSSDELALATLVNEYRRSHGLKDLLISDLCTDAAQKHSSDMAKYDFTGHISLRSDWFEPDADTVARLATCGYDWATSYGEDCAYGFDTPEELIDAWSKSEAHDANLLFAGFKVIGVGLARGGSLGTYWTLVFGGYIDPTAHAVDAGPTAPTNLVPAPGDGRVTLSWDPVPGAEGYNVYRDGVRVNAGLVTGTSYVDTASNGVAFSYYVTAVANAAESAPSLTVAAMPSSSSPGPYFLDVPTSNPYFEAIRHMAEAQIIGGYEVTGGREFRPGNPVNRAQFAKMIVGVLRLEVSEDLTSPFTDLGADDPADYYPHEFIAAAFREGIIKGKSSTSFAPWAGVTRSQVVTMVMRALQTIYPGLIAIPPVDYTNTWGTTYDPEQGPLARIAEHIGLLDGLPLTGAAADPWGAMPRGEVAQVLYNVMLKLGTD
jgi:uncharacterized protein YkwD